MSPQEVADAMAMATLAVSFISEPEAWPVFVAWVNRPELGDDDPMLRTREEAQSMGLALGSMLEFAATMAGVGE